MGERICEYARTCISKRNCWPFYPHRDIGIKSIFCTDVNKYVNLIPFVRDEHMDSDLSVYFIKKDKRKSNA